MKITIGIILGFVVGFVAHLVISKMHETEHNWLVVRNYNAFLSEPSNYKRDPATGFSVTTPPADPLPNLDALVAAGELSHVDLVLPQVPCNRDTGRQWMSFAQKHKEITYITGNPSYVAFKANGEQPLHLNIWFKDADSSIIQALIHELEDTASNSSQHGNPTNGIQPLSPETNQTASSPGTRR